MKILSILTITLSLSCSDQSAKMVADHKDSKEEVKESDGQQLKKMEDKKPTSSTENDIQTKEVSDNLNIKPELINDEVKKKVEEINKGCVENLEALNGKRFLLDVYRAIYTKDFFVKLTMEEMNTLKLDAIQSIQLEQGVKHANEFVDPKNGGLTKDNIIKGLQHTYAQAVLKVPANAKTAAAIENVIEINPQDGQTAKGTGWAWNSILYESNKEIFEIIYFYFGAELATGDGHFDTEVLYVAQSSKVSKICQ